MLSVTERAVYGASMSAVSQLSLNSKLVGLLTLKRPEGRAPTSRQLVNAPGQNFDAVSKNPRDARRVARRTLCLAAVSGRGLPEMAQLPREHTEAQRKRLLYHRLCPEID